LLLAIEAIQHRRLIKADRQFKYGLAYTYVIGAAFWNFVGAGVFGGGTLNAPLANYYEHGTFLTLNHAHTALFGAFGLLGIGLIYFCLRYIAADAHPFSERAGHWAFWLYNGGLVLWILSTSFRSAGPNSTPSSNMVWPTPEAKRSTTPPPSGNGCGCREISSSRRARG
jgi:nitric oxide reductase subunit B